MKFKIYYQSISTFIRIIFRDTISFSIGMNDVGWKEYILNYAGTQLFIRWIVHLHFQNHVYNPCRRMSKNKTLSNACPKMKKSKL